MSMAYTILCDGQKGPVLKFALIKNLFNNDFFRIPISFLLSKYY